MQYANIYYIFRVDILSYTERLSNNNVLRGTCIFNFDNYCPMLALGVVIFFYILHCYIDHRNCTYDKL